MPIVARDPRRRPGRARSSALVNGLLITQAKLPPFIATLGMMGVARGLTFIVVGEVAIYGLSGAFRNVGDRARSGRSRCHCST